MSRLTAAEQGQIGGDIQRRLGIKTSRDEPLARFSTMLRYSLAHSTPKCNTSGRSSAAFNRKRPLPIPISTSTRVVASTGRSNIAAQSIARMQVDGSTRCIRAY